MLSLPRESLPPADIVAAAELVGRWFAERHVTTWTLGPCQSRASGTPQDGEQIPGCGLPGLSAYDRRQLGLGPTRPGPDDPFGHHWSGHP